MSVWSWITEIVKPVTELVDELHTSDDERNQVKAKLFQLQNDTANKMLEYEGKLIEAQASIIRSEAQGQSWIQRNWRPITMLTFLVLVVCDSFGILAFRLADQAWTLLQLGLGGYVVGRSIEKVAPKVTEVIKK